MKKMALGLLLVLVLTGCTGTEKGAGIGAVAGAGLGAIIGYQSGHAAEGALIGGAVGAGGGALAGHAMDQEKKDK
ncbi:MAG: lipoprotein [Candidatus Omnitrophica bacterium]|nr:lipoprotein [Candidatus Omnitrophota bacterium]